MININCVVMNTNCKYKFVVKIYNKKSKLLKKFYIFNNENIKLNEKDAFYIIIISKDLYPKVILKKINEKKLIFKYYKFNNNPRKITFYLKDSLYKNLIIKKGEINLWPNHIQLI